MRSLILLLFVTLHFSILAQVSPWNIQWDTLLLSGKQAYLNDTSTDQTLAKKPNIILIVADDLGQTDISLYGSKLIQTPHIDAIGKNGVTFTDAYISSPVCSPSRAGLITGRYQQRFGHELQPCERYIKNKFEFWAIKQKKSLQPLVPVLNKDIPTSSDRMLQGLPPSEITLADVLKKNNYSTAMIGKWHLGSAEFAQPCNRGFDFQYGFTEAYTLYADEHDKNIINQKVPHQFMDEHQWKNAHGRKGLCTITRDCGTRIEETGYLTDRLTDEAIHFIQTRDSSQSFFIYLAYNAPHAPLQATKYYYDLFADECDPIKRIYLAMIKNLDDQVGRITLYLDSTGLSENTIIVFMSDNGGARYNGSTDNIPYRGGKMTNFEGGLRIPMMLQWKNNIESGTYTKPVISLDLFTTLCKLTHSRLPTDRVYDGIDLMNTESNKSDRALFWRSAENTAVRYQHWKLILNDIDHSKMLFDLDQNIEETKNIYVDHPDIVKLLESKLAVWQQSMRKPLWPGTVNYLYKDKNGRFQFAF